MDFNKLSTADKVIGASAIVFLIAFFLPWWGLENEFGSGSNNGLDYFLTGILPLLIVLTMVVFIGIQRFSTTQLPPAPLPWGQIYLIAGAVVAVLVVLRLIVPSSESAFGVDIDLDRMYGMFVAALAAIGVGVGGFLKSKEPEDSYSGPTSYPGSPPPPPPPGGQTF
jgi:hypothetical protein